MLALLCTIEASLFDIVFPLTEKAAPAVDRDDRDLCLRIVSVFRTSESTALAYILLFTVIVLTNHLCRPTAET